MNENTPSNHDPSDDLPINDDGLPHDPVERARVLSQDPEFLKEEAERQRQRDADECLRLLNDRGIFPQSREVPRRDYLARLGRGELETMKSLLEHVATQNYKKGGEDFGVIAVGTTTYPEEYWRRLEGLKDIPNAVYEEYEADIAEQSGKRYIGPFSIDDVLNRKGEDIDIKFCPLLRKEQEKTLPQDVIRDYADKHGITLRERTEKQVSGTLYHLEPPPGVAREGDVIEVQRINELTGHDLDSLVLDTPGGRPIHCYFENTGFEEKLKLEKSSGHYFSTLVHNNNAHDLIAAIDHGLETGTYENPLLLEWEAARGRKP